MRWYRNHRRPHKINLQVPSQRLLSSGTRDLAPVGSHHRVSATLGSSRSNIFATEFRSLLSIV